MQTPTFTMSERQPDRELRQKKAARAARKRQRQEAAMTLSERFDRLKLYTVQFLEDALLQQKFSDSTRIEVSKMLLDHEIKSKMLEVKALQLRQSESEMLIAKTI